MGQMGPPCEHRNVDTYTGQCFACGWAVGDSIWAEGYAEGYADGVLDQPSKTST